MSKAKKRRFSNKEQIKFAKENKDLVPSLNRYSRRSVNLSRWEKGAITRARKNIARFGGRNTLFSLTKSQSKKLVNKSLIIRHGIRGVRVNNPTKDTAISLDRKGELVIRQNGRRWRTVTVSPDLEKIEKALRKIVKRKPTAIAMLTSNGRSDTQADNVADMVGAIALWIASYEDFDEWFEGLTYFV